MQKENLAQRERILNESYQKLEIDEQKVQEKLQLHYLLNNLLKQFKNLFFFVV